MVADDRLLFPLDGRGELFSSQNHCPEQNCKASLFPHFLPLRLFTSLVTLTTLIRAPLTLQNVRAEGTQKQISLSGREEVGKKARTETKKAPSFLPATLPDILGFPFTLL